MIKKSIIFLSFMFTATAGADMQFSPGFLLFVQNFKTYYPHPAWVINDALKADANTFSQIFMLLTQVVGEKLERWYYLYDNKKAFKDDLDDAVQFINHFAEYHKAFERMAVAVDTMTLKMFDKKHFQEQEFERDGVVYQPILTYLKSNMKAEFELFYATYFSYLSYCFVDLAKEYYNTGKKELFPKINQYIDRLGIVWLDCLRGSEYEGRALQVLMRYYVLYHIGFIKK